MIDSIYGIITFNLSYLLKFYIISKVIGAYNQIYVGFD